MKKNASDNRQPAVDPIAIHWMAEVSVRLVGRDKTRPGYVVWRREPIAQGDATRYEFSLPEKLSFGGYFLVEVNDAIYEAGYKAGRQSVQAKMKRLLG